MTLTPKIFVSPVCNSKVNRGVEARENDIANIHFDTEQLGSSRPPTECSESRADGALAAGDAPARPRSPPSISDQSGSYVKVVVQKQRRATARLPTASSPTVVMPCTNTAAGENNAVPAAVLLACPAFAALHQQTWDRARSLLDASTRAAGPPPRGVACSGNVNANPQESNITKKSKKLSFWENLFDGKQTFDSFDDGPDRIEVYHFEPAAEYLCARDATRLTHVERAARRAGRPARALLAELLAAPRALLALPVHVAVQLERCLLVAVRGAVTGVVQTVSDQLLKPSLALVFNALLQPPLVLAARTANALREALRPVALAAGDAVEPLARLLAAVRLVHVERRCTCVGAQRV